MTVDSWESGRELFSPTVGTVPAFDFYSLVRVECHGVFSLGMNITKERHLGTAEMEEAHCGTDAEVDTDVTSVYLVTILSCLSAVLDEDRGSVAVLRAVDHLDDSVAGLLCNEWAHVRRFVEPAADSQAVNLFH